MQTMSLFPELLDYGFLATGILRITLGIILLRFWYQQIILKKGSERISFFDSIGLRPAKVYFRIISSIEGLVGLFLIIGLYTQVVAIVASGLMFTAVFFKLRKPNSPSFAPTEFYILFAIVSLSLLFLGPGAFALDLPL